MVMVARAAVLLQKPGLPIEREGLLCSGSDIFPSKQSPAKGTVVQLHCWFIDWYRY